jgi:hypothetical protein
MGINITGAMNTSQFENKENLRNAAKNILNKTNSSKETIDNIINENIFDYKNEIEKSNYNGINQVILNQSLKETLKYLKKNSQKKEKKQAKLGELWTLFNNSENDNIENELLDFVLDPNAKNIFSAA